MAKNLSCIYHLNPSRSAPKAGTLASCIHLHSVLDTSAPICPPQGQFFIHGQGVFPCFTSIWQGSCPLAVLAPQDTLCPKTQIITGLKTLFSPSHHQISCWTIAITPILIGTGLFSANWHRCWRDWNGCPILHPVILSAKNNHL